MGVKTFLWFNLKTLWFNLNFCIFTLDKLKMCVILKVGVFEWRCLCV